MSKLFEALGPPTTGQVPDNYKEASEIARKYGYTVPHMRYLLSRSNLNKMRLRGPDGVFRTYWEVE